MKGLFYPNIRMGLAQLECQDKGQSRIEITYSAASKDDENTILSPGFGNDAEHNLHKALLALKNVKDICWHIPIDRLLDTFIQVTRRN